jgi:hypothetical protein
LSGSTHKKVIVERFDREPMNGFVNPQTWLSDAGVELLTLSGSVVTLPFHDIRAVGFVKELDGNAPSQEKRLFTSRPKSEGLWVRLLFRDGDFLDGLLPNNLLQLSPHGFYVAPPDASSNNQKIFIPRAALTELKVLGVIGSPLKRRKRVPPAKEQMGLFE